MTDVAADTGADEGEAVAGEMVAADVAQLAALRAKLVQAELRTAAARAGMVDLDGVKMVDAASLEVNAAGELENGAAVMAALRQAKPWLFGRSSSSAAVAPRAAAPKQKTAMEMTVDEWRVARAELLRRR